MYFYMTLKRVILYVLTFLYSASFCCAQDDLLKEVDSLAIENSIKFDLPAFKTLKIGNLQSTKIAEKGELYLFVSHRFGPLKDGFDTFFGLDNANTKIELHYSFWNNIEFIISRESFEKTYSVASKFKFAKQSDKFPVNLVGFGSVNINSSISEITYPELKNADRYSYVLQLLASRRVSKNLSLEIAPTYIRENLQDLNATIVPNHNQFALGFGGRYKISKRVSLNAEYVHNFNRHKASIYTDPYTFGVDIETGGHVFQLLFTNGQSANETGYISKTEGEIAFGFNIVRVF